MNLTKKVCSVLKYLIFILLLIVSILLSKDVFEKYASKATSLKTYEEDITLKENLVVVMELWPLKKMDYPDSTPIQSYEKWKLGKDFALNFGVSNYKTAHEILSLKEDIQEYELSHKAVGSVRFEKWITKWGNSFKISADIVNTRSPYYAFFQVIFNKQIADEDIPSVGFILSSEDNSYGKILSDWVDGSKIHLSKVKGFKWVDVQPKKTILMEFQSKCSDIGFYQCFHSELVEQNYDHCPRRCFSISTYGNASPMCETLEEFQCSHEITKKLKNASKCLPSCSQINYAIETEVHEDEESRDAKRNVTLAYRFSKRIMKVEEEFLVHDFVGMLGSIGGTLGLFIGFSLFGLISFILENIQDFYLKQFVLKQSNKIDANTKEKKVIDILPNNDQEKETRDLVLELLAENELMKSRILSLENMSPKLS